MPAVLIERLVFNVVAKQLGCIDSNGDETAARLSGQLRKKVVRDAVCRELVSGVIFPVNREFTGKFAFF